MLVWRYCVSSNQMLKVFKELIRDSNKPVLVSFKKSVTRVDEPSPIMEIIESGNSNKLRHFELNSNYCEAIKDYYNLPALDSAAIFEDHNNSKVYYGSKNVRNYLRILSQKN